MKALHVACLLQHGLRILQYVSWDADWLCKHKDCRDTLRSAQEPVIDIAQTAERIGMVDYWRARGWPDLCRSMGADDFVCD